MSPEEKFHPKKADSGSATIALPTESGSGPDDLGVTTVGSHGDLNQMFEPGVVGARGIVTGLDILLPVDSGDLVAPSANCHEVTEQIEGELLCERIRSAEVTDVLIDEITGFFLETFRRDWPEFIVCKNCDSQNIDGARLSIAQAYPGVDPNQVDEHYIQSNPFPSCPCCQEDTMELFYDTSKTREIIAHKLSENAYITVLRDPSKDNIMAGCAFAYESTIGDQQDWHKRYIFTADPSHPRDLDRLVSSMNSVLKPDEAFTLDSPILVQNMIALRPEYREHETHKHFLTLMRELLVSLPETLRDRYMLSEVIANKGTHFLFKTGGGEDIPDFLEHGLLILATPIDVVTDRITSMTEEQVTLLAKAIKQMMRQRDRQVAILNSGNQEQ